MTTPPPDRRSPAVLDTVTTVSLMDLASLAWQAHPRVVSGYSVETAVVEGVEVVVAWSMVRFPLPAARTPAMLAATNPVKELEFICAVAAGSPIARQMSAVAFETQLRHFDRDLIRSAWDWPRLLDAVVVTAADAPARVVVPERRSRSARGRPIAGEPGRVTDTRRSWSGRRSAGRWGIGGLADRRWDLSWWWRLRHQPGNIQDLWDRYCLAGTPTGGAIDEIAKPVGVPGSVNRLCAVALTNSLAAALIAARQFGAVTWDRLDLAPWVRQLVSEAAVATRRPVEEHHLRRSILIWPEAALDTHPNEATYSNPGIEAEGL